MGKCYIEFSVLRPTIFALKANDLFNLLTFVLIKQPQINVPCNLSINTEFLNQIFWYSITNKNTRNMIFSYYKKEKM